LSKIVAIFFLCVLGMVVASSAQSLTDTTHIIETGKDTVVHTAVPTSSSSDIKSFSQEWVIPYPNPKKAGLYSAILPGAGQFYNKQYWKVPVVYAAVGAAAYFIYFNNNQYQSYRKAYIASLQGKPHEYSGMYDQAALKQLQDGYKRYLDMTYLLSAVGYTLQIIDAIVFAHLKNFDVSQDISLRLQPVAHPGGGAGIGLVFHMK
jgi:hypothetical protein